MKNKSFTLIEVIVAVAIFSLFVGTAVGIFASALSAQRKALANQELLDQTSYVMEYITRKLRMAKKDLTGECLTGVGAGYNYQITGSKNRIIFLNYENICQMFFYKKGKIYERKYLNHTDDDSLLGNVNLNSTNLKINSFIVSSSDNQGQNNDLQPRITLFLDIESKRISESPPRIQIQTTVSQRNLDIME